jgi:hypothetical protein
MMKTLLSVACVALLAGSAFGTMTWDGGVQGCDFDVYLTIGCWGQVICQDNDIQFSDQVGVDWDCNQLCGLAYGHNYTKAPNDPWAGYEDGGIYFESADGAYLWWSANCDIYCVIDPDDNMKNSGGDEVDSWFTMAATNDPDDGVLLDGEYKKDCDIPLDGWGCYANDNGETDGQDCCDDANEDGYMELCDFECCYPSQYCFAMADDHDFSSWCLNLPGPSAGTMNFLVRVHRNGMADAGGAYTAHIDVDFFEGTCQ